MVLERIIALVIGYVLGSFITAVPVCKYLAHTDIFTIDSHNPGFANVLEHVGKREAVLTLAGDLLKVVLAMGIVWAIYRRSYQEMCLLWVWTGLGEVLGHDFPFWNKFRGGKGVAVTCAYLFLGLPIWGLASMLVGGVYTLLSGNLWIGAIIIPAVATPFAFWKLGVPGGLAMLAITLVTVQRNIGSLKRLKNGDAHLYFGHNKKDQQEKK